MNLADGIIMVLLVISLIRGAGIGSIRQILSTVGFFSGIFLGAWLAPAVSNNTHTQFARTWLSLLVTLGFGLVLLAIGEYVGLLLKSKLVRHWADYIDRGLGALVGGATLLAVIWFASGVLVEVAAPSFQNQLKDSAIISFLDHSLPPLPTIIADISHVIDPNGFPRVFTGNEPVPINANTAVPSIGTLTAAVQKDVVSVVKVEGLGCGGIVEGSGFVADAGYVATNAHVIAGVKHPFVIDSNGRHATQVLWFDPNLDFAVLAVSNLAGQPLAIDTTIATTGTATAVLGYPGGGAFNAQPAVILDEFEATGRNIYNQGTTNRDIYEVKASVVPGNSGGPLITTNGSVVGVIFATSTTYNQIGFALTTPRIKAALIKAETLQHIVATSACAE